MSATLCKEAKSPVTQRQVSNSHSSGSLCAACVKSLVGCSFRTSQPLSGVPPEGTTLPLRPFFCSLQPVMLPEGISLQPLPTGKVGLLAGLFTVILFTVAFGVISLLWQPLLAGRASLF